MPISASLVINSFAIFNAFTISECSQLSGVHQHIRANRHGLQATQWDHQQTQAVYKPPQCQQNAFLSERSGIFALYTGIICVMGGRYGPALTQ